MERSNSNGDILFNTLIAEAATELTNERPVPASMTYGTVSVLERNERSCCERGAVATYEVWTTSL